MRLFEGTNAKHDTYKENNVPPKNIGDLAQKIWHI